MLNSDVGIYVSSIPKYEIQITWKKENSKKLQLSKLAIEVFILDEILATRVDQEIVSFHFNVNHSSQIQMKAKKLGLEVVRIDDGIDSCMLPFVRCSLSQVIDLFEEALHLYLDIHLAKSEFRRYGDYLAYPLVVRSTKYFAVSSIVC
jgi:hypothetical protein